MKKWNKLLALGMAFSMTLALTACSGQSADTSGEAAEPQSAAPSTALPIRRMHRKREKKRPMNLQHSLSGMDLPVQTVKSFSRLWMILMRQTNGILPLKWT